MDLLVAEEALDIVQLAVVVPDVADRDVGEGHHRRGHAPRGHLGGVEMLVAGLGEGGAELADGFHQTADGGFLRSVGLAQLGHGVVGVGLLALQDSGGPAQIADDVRDQ